ncbi:MAG TPA: copper resistance CopC family protein [Miltoncostaeaceae bacterium]|nr:copper resistance CopC family protein [Miltoncostaeaceae bacterium]
MRTARAVAAVAAAGCVASLGAATALGHSVVESSTPKQGAKLARTPVTVTLRYDEPIQRIGTITVTRNGRQNLARSSRIAPRDATRITISLRRPGAKNQNGTYRVRWRVTGVDGHTVSGVVSFRVKRPSGRIAPTQAASAPREA